MIIHIILFSGILFLIIALLAPLFIRKNLEKHFSTVQMTLFNPFSLRGIMLNGKTSSWGLQKLTIYISSIELKFSLKKFKLSLTFQNVQTFCTRKLISLVPVNLIDGCQEANILFNFLNYINSADFARNPETVQQASSPDKKKNTLQYFSEAIIHLLMLLIMHIVEVNVIDFKMFVVSGHPQDMISFEDNQKRKKSLMLMQCLAEYSLSCDVISVKSKIQNHDKYQLNFSCSQILCNSFLHWKNTFFQLKDIKLNLTIPFSMSIDQSYKEMSFKIEIKQGNLNLIPSDFDHFFQFIVNIVITQKEVVFNPYKQKTEVISNSQQSKVSIYINLVKINLEDIYEADFDNLEAKEYLTNINNATLTLQHIVKDQKGFSVELSSLSIRKFSNEFSESRLIQVLKLPNLSIFSIPESDFTEITHDDITLICQSQEIAFFGKIFSLLNSRIRFENYNQEIYKQLISQYIEGSTLISEMERILDPTESQSRNLIESGYQKKNKLMYAPKKIDIQIKMIKLRHYITIEGFTYTRQYGYHEMSHVISIPKFSVEYRDKKEFIVSDFRLTYSLTNNQDHLNIMIEDITMNQDEETLIDYLDSFTLFKHLLQFESDEERKVTKFAKKNVSVFKITLNFGKETVTLKSLEVNKESHINEVLNSIYFSLENSSILMARLRPQKPLFKPFINKDTVIFSLDSLSLKQNFEIRNGKPKMKVNFIIKDPCITLPEVDITSRILGYLSIFSNMDNHIQAYMRNVSNEKFKYIKYRLKEFLEEPPILSIILTKIKINLVDNKLDNKILSFSKTVREQLCIMKKYNQAEVLNVLRRNNKQKFLLLDIQVEKIRLTVNPIKQLQPFETSILNWIRQFSNTHQLKEKAEHRMKQVFAANLQLKLKNIDVKIRDYPMSILRMSKIFFEGNLLQIKRVFGERENYVHGKFQLGELQLNVGLGQLSGFKQIGKRVSQFNVITKNKNKKSLSLKQTKTFLHNIFQHWNWKVTFLKDNLSVINILTGSTPYEKEKFELNIGTFKIESHNKSTLFNLNNLHLKFKDLNLMIIPQIQLKLIVFLNKGEFGFDVLVDASEETQIQISCGLMKYIQQLGQLRKDWLLIYGIYEQTIKKEEIDTEQIQNMSYAEIANLLLTQTVNRQGRHSLLNLIGQIKIVGTFKSMKISLVEEDLQFSLVAIKTSCFFMVKPNHDLYNKFEVIRSNISALQVAAIFKKLHTMGETIMQSRIVTELLDHFSKKEGIIYPVLTCSNFTINFNWYFVESWITGRSNICISIDQIEGQISKKIQRYFLTILKAIQNSKLSIKHEEVGRSFKPLSKFRSAIMEIIQINRRNKIKKGHIKKFKFVIDIHSYKLVLKHYERQMTLRSNKKASFYISTQYSDNDMYHARPEQQTLLIFPQCIISISQRSSKHESFHLKDIMKIKSLRIELHKVKLEQKSDFVNWGDCQLSDVSVELDSESKNFLNEFINFVVDILNTSEERVRLYREQMQKYSELINKKSEKIKQKILWNQSDLKNNQKEIFRWNFLFKNFNITIINEKSPFLTIFTDSAKINMNIFSNSRINRKIIMKKLLISNRLQQKESFFRTVLELGQQGPSLTVLIETYEVPAFSDVLWKFYKELSIEMDSIKVKMTEELLQCINSFFESEEEEEGVFKSELEEYSSKSPDFIKVLTFEPLALQLWFKSVSAFKRMDGIKVNLERYQLHEKLYTKTQMRRAWTVWLLKQLASQALWVLEQKIFGEKEKEEN